MLMMMIALVMLIFPVQGILAYDHNAIKGNAYSCSNLSKNNNKIKSKNSHYSTEIKFINKTRSNILTYWIDFKGDPVFYSEIESKSSITQPTYVTHPWVVVRADMKCFGPFMPKRTMKTVIIN
jgi:hypothetical protein